MADKDKASQLALIDKSGDRRYFTMIPNLLWAPELQLTAHDILLYATIKRIAGENGTCFMGTRALAQEAKMSVGQVSKSKKALVRAGLIHIVSKRRAEDHLPVDHITIRDIWERNVRYFSALYGRSSSEQQVVHEVVHEVVHPVKQNKNPLNKNREEERPSSENAETSPKSDDWLPSAEEQIKILSGGRLRQKQDDAYRQLDEKYAEIKGIEIPQSEYRLKKWHEAWDILLVELKHDLERALSALRTMALDDKGRAWLLESSAPMAIVNDLVDIGQSGKLRRKPGGPTEAELRREAKRCYRQAISPYGQCLWVLGYNLAQCQFCPYPKEHPDERKGRRKLAKEDKEQPAGPIAGHRKVAEAVAAVAGKMRGNEASGPEP